MRSFVSLLLLAFVPASFALTPNLPSGRVGPELVVTTSRGVLRGVILAAPTPALRNVPANIGRGLFAIDIGAVSGQPASVRVIKSTGSGEVDNSVINTLYGWRFQPRVLATAYVPVDVRRTISNPGR